MRTDVGDRLIDRGRNHGRDHLVLPSDKPDELGGAARSHKSGVQPPGREAGPRRKMPQEWFLILEAPPRNFAMTVVTGSSCRQLRMVDGWWRRSPRTVRATVGRGVGLPPRFRSCTSGTIVTTSFGICQRPRQATTGYYSPTGNNLQKFA